MSPDNQPGHFSRDAIVLAALLVLPVLALLRLTSTYDWRLLFSVPALLSAVTFCYYWHDKRRAQSGGWRTPESNLHTMALFGGWPGAFMGQRAFRHKTSKLRFQIIFWMIVTIYQLASIDCLSGWQVSRKLLPILGN